MDNNHHKPTQEELTESIRKTQEELDKATEDTPTEETLTEESVSEETPTEDVVQQEEEQPVQEQIEETSEEQQPDYREKFTHSTREAQILAAKNKKMQEAIEQAGEIPEPTEDDLIAEAAQQGFHFEDMSDVEKALFKKAVHNERKVSKISEVAKEGKNIDEWNKSVDEFIDNPKTLLDRPQLEGKQEAFKVFASKPTRRGIDFETLVSSFLWEAEYSKPKHKGQMFPTGNGGLKEKPKEDKVSVEDAAKLMKTNYKEYKRLLIAGKIATQ